MRMGRSVVSYRAHRSADPRILFRASTSSPVYGAWIDGASLLMLALYLAGFIALLAVLLSVASRHASSLKGV